MRNRPSTSSATAPMPLPVGTWWKGIRVAIVLLAVQGVLGAVAPVAGAASIAQRVDRAVDRSGIGSTTSVIVYDAARRTVIYRYRGTRQVTPASNQKLYTAAAVLEGLGPQHRFQTRVALRGEQVGSTWRGDVYLIGGGDPSLSTRSFGVRNFGGHAGNLNLLTGPLRVRGIERIRGRLIVNEGWLDRQRYVASWPVRFRYDEAPALGALTVNHNYLGRGLSGPSARQPALRAGKVYRDLLEARGITFTRGTRVGSVPPEAQVVGTIESPPVWVLVRYMGRFSDNFTAEILLKDLARVRGGAGAGTTARGVQVMRNRLRALGLNVTPLRLADGSGLSTGNRTNVRNIADLLHIMDSHASLARPFRASLAVSGGAGTLHNRLDSWPYRGRVIAKTGTLDQSSALSGYATRLNRRRFGFAVVTYRGGGVSWTRSRRLQDRIAMILVR